MFVAFLLKGGVGVQIHVVQNGDTLFSIASTYDTTVPVLFEANELTTEQLVIGQALVIPINGQYYFVEAGDSLFSIAEQFQLSSEMLARINQVNMNDALPVGLRLYIPPLPKQPITSFGYIEPFGDTVSPTLENAARTNSPLLTFLAPFSYRVNRDGTLNPPPLNQLLEIASENMTYRSMVITNLAGPAFDSELVKIILNVKEVQRKLIDNIINTAITTGFQDIHFDFEFILPEDRDAYEAFLQKMRERTSQSDLLLSTALAPKTTRTQKGLLYEAHDYAVHGRLADFSIIMTYEWGYSAGPPLPVSPINEVEKVLRYALTEMPPEKIIMGQNLYGYDWTLPFIQGESFARALSPQQAIQIALENNVTISYDETAQAPFFEYIDEEDREHIVWFEDARSIQAKFNLIKELGILGIAYWKLGLAFPQNWLLLADNFYINKMDE